MRLNFNEFMITSNKFGLNFTNLLTMRVDENLSAIFSKSLSNLGFKFPFKVHFSNPNTKNLSMKKYFCARKVRNLSFKDGKFYPCLRKKLG